MNGTCHVIWMNWPGFMFSFLRLFNTLRPFAFVNFDADDLDDKFIDVVLTTKQALILCNACVILVSIYLSSSLDSNASIVPLSTTRSNVGPYSCRTNDKSRISATTQWICDHLTLCELAQNVLSLRYVLRYRCFIFAMTTYE